MTETYPKCVQCGVDMPLGPIHRKYCSRLCKGRWQRAHSNPGPVTHHKCRSCGKLFQIGPGQNNKWLCSDDCRRASNAKSIREFHKRRPMVESVYRARTKAKCYPDSRNIRFYRLNPDAPRQCESCGEDRVVEVAHKPEHRRHGARISGLNSKWPEMVWVLCPTCHRLLDRMHYPPEDLGLS